MKNSPIIFSGPMVRAILEGRKTQTRRILKPEPGEHWKKELQYFSNTLDRMLYEKEGEAMFHRPIGGGIVIRCPYGVAGDRLYVREKWRTKREWDKLAPSQLPIIDYALPDCDVDFATNPSREIHGRWRSALHMPKNFARIWLEITGVRVERLQEISERDALAEGCEQLLSGGTLESNIVFSAKERYRDLWDSINGKGAWDKNPWVWVVDFKSL